MAHTSATPEEELITGINVTPLVDVVLVLLVIMMVTATFIASQAIPLELPKAASGESRPQDPLVISIDRAGAVFLDGQKIAMRSLGEQVRPRCAGQPCTALIAADGAAAHREVVSVIDVLRSSGISQFALNVDPAALEAAR